MTDIEEKVTDSVNAIIRRDFDITWWMDDFIGAWKKSKGITNELTDAQWEEFDRDMHEPGFLRNFRNTCIEEINERISCLFG